MKVRTVEEVTTVKNGVGDALAANREFARMVENVVFSRSELFKKYFDPRRDINDECGYPLTDGITADLLREMYDREAVAARVVEVMPKETWQVQPTVYEDEDSDSVTAFEEAWDALGKGLHGSKSWYGSERGNLVWNYLLRADVLCGIGSYGVMLLGLDDGKDLREEAKPKEGARLLFLRCFDESQAAIASYETDPKSERYGQPAAYNLVFADPNDTGRGGIGLPNTAAMVHWTRVVHVADNLGSSDVFGVPRQRPVWNNLLNLRKLYGGSSEMYWRGAFPGLSLETNPQLGADVIVDTAGLKDKLENYMNGLQRYLYTTGMVAKTLAPQVVDPTPQIDVQITAICIKIACPKRVFMGSERGELASSQDDQAWNDRLRQRQSDHVTPRIIVPFVDRLIALGVLPEPEEYAVDWPDLTSQSEQEKATVAVTKTDAMVKYIAGNGEALMNPLDFMTRFLGMEEDEAESVLKAAAEIPPDDRLTAPAQPEQAPPLPIKVKEGEALVAPDGTPVAPQTAKKPNPFVKKEAGKSTNPFAENAFCPTGEGGGIDPSCSPEGDPAEEGGGEAAALKAEAKWADEATAQQVMLRAAHEESAAILAKRSADSSKSEKDYREAARLLRVSADHYKKITLNPVLSKVDLKYAKTMAPRLASAADQYERLAEEAGKSKNPSEPTTHSFCPTGEGGGIDPSCSPESARSEKVTGRMVKSAISLSEKAAEAYMKVSGGKEDASGQPG